MPQFESFIKDSRSGRRTSATGRRLSKGTIVQYMQAFRMLEEYEKSLGSPVLLPVFVRSSTVQHRKLQKEWSRLKFQLTKFLYLEKNVYDQYAGSFLKIFRTVCRYLVKEKGLGLGEYYQLLKAPAEQFRPLILSPERLRFLMIDKNFESVLSKSEINVKLIFLTGCLVGLRFSDLMRVRNEDLYEEEGITYLSLTTGKTGSEVKIPLPEKMMEQLRAQRGRRGRYLLPRISNARFNINIKKLMEKAGWVEIRRRYKHRQGKLIEQKKNGKSWRFCDHITAHTMRRTAITCLLMMGVEEAVVRRVSGHAPGSREFHRYVVLSQTYINNKLIEAQEKLIG